MSIIGLHSIKPQKVNIVAIDFVILIFDSNLLSMP